MLYQRVLTAAVLGVVFLGPAILGGSWFLVLITALGLIGYSELLRMKNYKLYEIPSLGGFILTSTWLWLGPKWIVDIQAAMILWIVYGFLLMTVVLKNRYTFKDMSYLFVGTIYIGLSLHYVLQLRGLQDGLLLLLFVVFVIWATDIGAFFVGRWVKGPKLWPSISPNKTVSGAIGGLAFAVLISMGFYLTAGNQHPMVQWVITAVCVSLAGQIGDFVESGIKRSMNVKDSGTILPGHGGVLDRFDSLLFAAPIAYHMVVWFQF